MTFFDSVKSDIHNKTNPKHYKALYVAQITIDKPPHMVLHNNREEDMTTNCRYEIEIETDENDEPEYIRYKNGYILIYDVERCEFVEGCYQRMTCKPMS